MSAPNYTLSGIMTSILDSIQNIIGSIVDTISANAGVIATVVVLGGLAFIFFRFGGRLISSVTSWFSNMFRGF